jgi:hypothetical protein
MEVLFLIAFLAGIATLLVLHRFRSGKKDSSSISSSVAGPFIAFQEFVEPNIKHVIQVKEQKRHSSDIGPPPDDLESEKPKSPACD